MATVYCDPSATGTGSGADWTNAYTSLQTALTNAANGGRVYFKDDGVTLETTAANVTYTFPTGTGITEVIGCLAATTATPPTSSDLATKGHANGPTIITSTAGDVITIVNNQYIKGCKISAGGGIQVDTRNDEIAIWEDCEIKPNTLSGLVKTFGVAGIDTGILYLNNCDMETLNGTFANYIHLTQGARLIWNGGATTGVGSASYEIFSMNNQSARLDVNGVDLSSCTSSLGLLNFNDSAHIAELNRCYLPSGITRVGNWGSDRNASLKLYSCDSADTNYQFEDYSYQGTLTTNISKYRTSGASDGTTNYSFTVTGTNNSEFYLPHKVKIADLWLDASTAKTLTVHFAQDHATVPPTALQDDEIWIEVHYKKSASPLLLIDDDSMGDVMATAADQTASTEAWIGLAAQTTKQQLAVTTSGGDEGQAEVYLCTNLASTQTAYVCPLVEVT